MIQARPAEGSEVSAVFAIHDGGEVLSVRGVAAGLFPGDIYVTLLYASGDCSPPGFPIGEWGQRGQSGLGMLRTAIDSVDFNAANSVSIRNFAQDGALEACGALHVD